MASHRALVCSRLTRDLSGLSIEQRPTAEPGPGQVRVRMRAAALNFPDLLMSEGGYQFKPPLPFVGGMEGAGVIDAVGEGVTGLAAGDAVSVHSRVGTIAESVVAGADAVRPLPAGFDFAEGAAYSVTALTAWVALTRRGNLQRGETLLVHGASGGTGYAAVQLGKHLGATVIATGSSETKLQAAAQAGADHLIVLGRDKPGFREPVKALTQDRGVDVVFDPVGGDVFDESVRVMGWGGRLLIIGFASGRIPVVPVNMPLIKGFSVVGVRAGESGRRDPAAGAHDRQAVERLASQGMFRPLIGARFPLADAVAAYRALAGRGVAGKVVVEM
ncbi:MAG TPA: NADPH:quinone oxidoreductase family protein [Burkholderiaceae bacterium]|nr:NADPH:quinone oxidoreductase family protein [Burkholderiaceae bacterium]